MKELGKRVGLGADGYGMYEVHVQMYGSVDVICSRTASLTISTLASQVLCDAEIRLLTSSIYDENLRY